MKIFIAVPTFENIYPDTFKSIYDLDKAGHRCVFDFVRGYDVATARNRIVYKAQSMDADFILMVDNDVVLPDDALINLLDDVKDVCLGFYAHRTVDNIFDGRTSVSKLGEYNYTPDYQFHVDELKAAREQGNFKIRIHGGGMGCALIRTDVFNKFSYPWYDWVNYGGTKRSMLSEDLYFCEQCRKAGIPIYTDSRVGCGHMLRHIENVL